MSGGQPLLVAPNQFHSTAAGGAYYVNPGAFPYIDPTRGMVYLDNYFFFVSTINQTGVDPYNALWCTSYQGDPFGPWDQTAYMLVQQFSNEVVWIDKHHNYLVAFCEQSIEFFYDAGNGLGSPLGRQPIYAKSLGIQRFPNYNTQVAKNRDDIYFIGKGPDNYYDVWKLSQFQITPVGTHYVREVLNYYGSQTQNTIAGIETIYIDSHTMIMVSFTGSSQNLVYFPEEDAWWTISTTDLNDLGNIRSNIVLCAQYGVNSQRPYYVTATSGSSTLNFCSTDLEFQVATTATYYSEVVDMDTNNWKHISRVHSIGDYGNRTITLWYSNDPTYTSFVTTLPVTPSTDGYQNAIRWSNVTRFRRGAFRVDMVGTGPSHHRALDVEYNIGNA